MSDEPEDARQFEQFRRYVSMNLRALLAASARRFFTEKNSLLPLWAELLDLDPDAVRVRFQREQNRRDGRAA